MDKYEALYKFYSSFGIPAYEENSVDDKAKMPYLTYEVITASFDADSVAISCQLYFKSKDLTEIDRLAEKISAALSGGVCLKCDNGYIALYKGTPFAQNRPTGDKSVKCKYLNISADFITQT